jgi:hypothetical protein
VAGATSARRVGRWHDPTTVEMGGWRQRRAKSGGSLIGVQGHGKGVGDVRGPAERESETAEWGRPKFKFEI